MNNRMTLIEEMRHVAPAKDDRGLDIRILDYPEARPHLLMLMDAKKVWTTGTWRDQLMPELGLEAASRDEQLDGHAKSLMDPHPKNYAFYVRFRGGTAVQVRTVVRVHPTEYGTIWTVATETAYGTYSLGRIMWDIGCRTSAAWVDPGHPTQLDVLTKTVGMTLDKRTEGEMRWKLTHTFTERP